jgi:hypothetical protein
LQRHQYQGYKPFPQPLHSGHHCVRFRTLWRDLFGLGRDVQPITLV